MAAVVASMDTILMENLKMWKVTDRHTDDRWTMVNRPQHNLTWSKAPDELTIEIFKMAAVTAIMDIVTKWF